MPIAADIAHEWGGDLGVSPTGDLALVTGSDRTTQRVLRRLLTTATTAMQSDYPWLPTYGAGMGGRIGLPGVDPREMQAMVQGQLNRETSVARSPAPVVTVTQPSIGTFEIDCRYTDQSGLVQGFAFDLDGSA